jgi:hypothetical protein
MARGVGSISLLIDSPLQDLARALRAVGPEVRKQINAATKAEAQPIWFEETRDRAATRLKQRTLVSTARVSVSSRNVVLRAGVASPVLSGKRAGGKSADSIARAAEFAGGAGKVITSRTKTGTTYTRRMGASFGPRYRNGSVAYPSAADSIPRFASLWVSTARRTIHEAIEEV